VSAYYVSVKYNTILKGDVSVKVDALFMTAPKKIEIRQIEVGEPKYDEIQIEIKANGICKWDQNLFKGNSLVAEFPFTFGHEPAGVVIKVGEGVTGFKKGDSVFCCGGTDSMAQVVNMPARCAVVITEPVSDYSLWAAEPICCVVNSVANVPFCPGDDVLLVGAGYMGLLKIHALNKMLRGRLIVLDLDDRRVALAKEFGADEAYNANSSEAKKRIEQIVANGGIDLVIECSGEEEGFNTAIKCTKQSGVLELFGWQRGLRTFDGTPWHMDGIRIYNSAPNIERFYEAQRIKQTEKLVACGVFDQTKLVTHRTNYKYAQEALERAIAKDDGYIKGTITF